MWLTLMDIALWLIGRERPSRIVFDPPIRIGPGETLGTWREPE